ncbi:AIPR family protein [Bosea eneae]|uniref:AIPR family protein n=1 Tax=Bosea eneae TaxID=151454 RepID=A0ABW0J234_9HYPH
MASLSDYNKFLRGGSAVDKVKAELFESNVRDFQGDTEVNAEIVKTLESEETVDFWCMNNGVTILSSRTTMNGDTATIENPQIVNGLQTSTQIARHFDENPEKNDSRNVMIKIVSSENEEIRDKIIKATNSQNAVPPASLRATDKVQRDIEQTLKGHGLFYDRRKNFYKNEGKPADKIISIPLMAQAVMSMILNRPDSARARPSSLIKDNSVYSEVFSESHPVSLYLNAATIIKSIDRVLKGRAEMGARDRSNLRFYILYWITAKHTKKLTPSAGDVSKLDAKTINDPEIEKATDEVWNIYQILGATDQIAKGTELRKRLMEKIQESLPKWCSN